MQEDLEFELSSKKEFEENGGFSGGFTALQEDDYVLKCVDIKLEDVNDWANGPGKQRRMLETTHLAFIPTFLVYGTKSGDPILDIDNKEQPELFRRLRGKPLDPTRTGFNLNTQEPSMLRIFIALMNGSDANERCKPPGFILFDPKGKLVEDANLRKQALYETSTPNEKSSEEWRKNFESKELIKKGYKVLPDIRPFIGKYIGAHVIKVESKKQEGIFFNNIKFYSKVPSKFKVDAELEAEAMKKYYESLEKKKAKEAGVAEDSVQVEDYRQQDEVMPWEQ